MKKLVDDDSVGAVGIDIWLRFCYARKRRGHSFMRLETLISVGREKPANNEGDSTWITYEAAW